MKSAAVIIPTYNRWPTVRTAIESVLAQTHGSCSCVVVDDASSDGSAGALAREYGGRIELLRMDRNSGQSACKNLGAESARTDYVCFLDSDDMLYPDAVSARVSLLEELASPDSRASFGVFKTPSGRWRDISGRKKRGDRLGIGEYIRDRAWCNNNGFLVERRLFLDAGGYNPRLRDKEDIELILRLMARTGFLYCGGQIGEVRDVCAGGRQRERHDQVIAQGTMFSEALKGDRRLVAELDESEMSLLLCKETEDLLRALYRSGRYSEFRSRLLDALGRGAVRNRSKFAGRYIASVLKGMLPGNSAGA